MFISRKSVIAELVITLSAYFGIIPLFDACSDGIIPLFTPYFNGIIPVFTFYFNGIIPLFEG